MYNAITLLLILPLAIALVAFLIDAKIGYTRARNER